MRGDLDLVDIALLLDFTRSLSREERLSIIDLFKEINIRLFVLYGIRAYPVCENNCRISAKLKNIISLIPDIDGPPEPYRAVKEVIEYTIQYNYLVDDVILVWSAPRKPLVDLSIAFNIVEASNMRMHMVITRPHSARWLVKMINKLENKNIIIPRKNQNSTKVLAKLVNELIR